MPVAQEGGLTDDHDEPHPETTETTHVRQEHQFCQVMNGRIDPSTTLREKNVPSIRSDRHCLRVSSELGLVVREMLENERR